MIPGLPDAHSAAVLALLRQQLGLEQVLLYGSRAMGRHHSGSDVDLCLVAPSLQLEDLLLLGARLDDLLLPWLRMKPSCRDVLAMDFMFCRSLASSSIP